MQFVKFTPQTTCPPKLALGAIERECLWVWTWGVDCRMEKRIKDLHRVSCVLVFCAQRLQCSKFTKSKFHENL